MPVFRDSPCSARAGGLTHIQNTQVRPDGSCLYCGQALTTNPDAVAKPAAPDVSKVTGEFDDRIGPQTPYEDEQCPARGPALSHYRPDRVAGPCLHCRQPVVLRVDLDMIFERPGVLPYYADTRSDHGQKAMVAYRNHRPLLSAKHAWAARLLMRAGQAERLNPIPSAE